MTDRFQLIEKWALVTGAAGLLGFEHSAALLEANASVIITDVDEDRLKSSEKKLNELFPNQGVKALFMDVTSESSIIKTKWTSCFVRP